MADIITGLFSDTQHAGKAIAELKEKGYTKDISVIAKDERKGEVSTHQVKQEIAEGTATGAITGAAIGGAAALLAGASSIVLPGIGLVVAGPLATALTAATAGALTGGIVGTLVELGIPDKQAREYEDRIMHGEVLVAVKTTEENAVDVKRIIRAHGGKAHDEIEHQIGL